MQKIAVFIPSKPFFGATVLLIPFFQNIREQYPNSHIFVFSTTPIINILKPLQLFDKTEIYSEKKVRPILKPLLQYKPDLIINFRSNSERLNFVCLWSFSSKKIGFKSSSLLSFMYHYKPERDKNSYRVLDFFKLLENPLFKPHFGFQKISNLANLDQQLPIDKNRINICLMPGGGEGEHKKWGIENFISLVNLIKIKYPNAFFHFVIGKQEEPEMKILQSQFDKTSVAVYMNETIPHILQIVLTSVITIANDCGPSHLAQMCNGYYIGVWGWSKKDPISTIAEWTHKSPKSFAVLAEKNQDIKTLSPQIVFQKTNEILLESNK